MIELIQLYYAITNPSIRRQFLEMARSVNNEVGFREFGDFIRPMGVPANSGSRNGSTSNILSHQLDPTGWLRDPSMCRSKLTVLGPAEASATEGGPSGSNPVATDR